MMINYGAYSHVKTYFFYHDVDGMLSLKGRGTGVDPSVIDSGMIDGEAVFQGRIPARSTCPALMKRRRKKAYHQVETEKKKKKGQNALAQIHPLLARKFTIKSSPPHARNICLAAHFSSVKTKSLANGSGLFSPSILPSFTVTAIPKGYTIGLST